jgi:hypothetical protein
MMNTSHQRLVGRPWLKLQGRTRPPRLIRFKEKQIRAAYDANGKLADYSITFIRKREDTYWYDEIRYDSHERPHGRKVLAPHFHMKIHCTFKANADTAVEEISSLIKNDLQRIEKIIGT